MQNLGRTSPGASAGIDTRPEPPRPSELSIGLSALLQVGGAQWFVRRVRLYADPWPSLRCRVRCYLEHRDGSRDVAELAPAPRRPLAVEIVGDGPSLMDALSNLAAQILPACRLLQLGNDAAAVRAELERTCPDCYRPNDAHAESCRKGRAS